MARRFPCSVAQANERPRSLWKKRSALELEGRRSEDWTKPCTACVHRGHSHGHPLRTCRPHAPDPTFPSIWGSGTVEMIQKEKKKTKTKKIQQKREGIREPTNVSSSWRWLRNTDHTPFKEGNRKVGSEVMKVNWQTLGTFSPRNNACPSRSNGMEGTSSL